MPDIDSLLDVLPEDFEQALQTTSLFLPDIDLSLAEYARTLCSLLDIPIYENPIESLYQMFVLFVDFKNNPHLNAHKSKYR
jgi:intraflagellar transport protein 46